MSASSYLEVKLLNHLRGVPYVPPAGLYVQNHLGDPGDTGLLRQAANKVRQLVVFDPPDDEGVMRNAVGLTWFKVPAAETYSHFSIWDALSGGNNLGAGIWDEEHSFSVGDNATCDPGSLVWTIE